MSAAMTAKRLLLPVAFALAVPAFGASGDPEVGQKKSTPCQVCHGPEGISVSPEFPNLAGQHPDYLLTALRHYQNGKRKNPIMKLQVEKLTDKDLMDLAAYFSHQHGLVAKR
jgi:cytochrome c553